LRPVEQVIRAVETAEKFNDNTPLRQNTFAWMLRCAEDGTYRYAAELLQKAIQLVRRLRFQHDARERPELLDQFIQMRPDLADVLRKAASVVKARSEEDPGS
jgi:hypothetical protein